MGKELACLLIVIAILTGMFIAINRAIRVRAAETIYIRPNGDVEGTDKIQRDGDNYIFIDNVNERIVVERDNIVVDGADFALRGPGSGVVAGIDLSSRYNVTIRNVEITDFYYGIFVYSSSGVALVSNKALNTTDGILLALSSNSTLAGNDVLNSTVGINFTFSNSSTLTGNNASDNSEGISLVQSNNNTVVGNNVSNNTYSGICLSSSSNNTLTDNHISNNTRGITFFSSGDNVFFHNRFVDNAAHVESVNSANVWDDGYPSGGNYWSDYSERYPDASEIDGLGIWDTPYVIDENNQDNYPLIPEFPLPAILLAFIMATLLIAIVSRKKRTLST